MKVNIKVQMNVTAMFTLFPPDVQPLCYPSVASMIAPQAKLWVKSPEFLSLAAVHRPLA